MPLTYRYVRMRLAHWGLFPASKFALITWYLLALDLLLFFLQKVFSRLKPSFGQSLGGWVSFLSFVAIVLFAILAIRWLKARLLWRLRNRLIVTYVFIGVIPVVLLVTLALGSLYLFAGQFATFVVTTGLDSELKSLEAANSALAHGFAARLERGALGETPGIEQLRRHNSAWANRRVCAWVDGKLVLINPPASDSSPAPALPSYLKPHFADVVRDGNRLFLRAAEQIALAKNTLTVLSSEPLDQFLLQKLAGNLGEVTLYEGLTIRKLDQSSSGSAVANPPGKPRAEISVRKSDGQYVLDTGNQPTPTYTVGAVPPASGMFDHQVTFPTSVTVVNWQTGDTSSPAAVSVQTRFSTLYGRLFGALGDFAPAVEYSLLIVAVVFGIIELVALFIGTRLTRTVTASVAQLYDATAHINRGDFSHRIPVKSNDQLASLANSFNSMTASLEQLINEQKQKQRLENELAIAKEVQAQLFPRQVSQLSALEVFGFCRPARTVSGDYYDFLPLDEDRLLLAVGDISGKGISAALLMATVHSAVRAYSLEGIPILRESLAVGAGLGSSSVLDSMLRGPEPSPGTLLSLLNHQLFESTPPEKYATLFLGIYDGRDRRFIYSNGGHLPPLILSASGSVRKLDRGGTVIGLFDNRSYEEASISLQPGEIFLAYSDGVTEPENDFGEFGEERLLAAVLENRGLPLARISEIVTSAVDDWIGDKEQPDDVTLVLARQLD